MAGWGSQYYRTFYKTPQYVAANYTPNAQQATINVDASNPGALAQGGSGLAPGYSIVNGRFYYNGQPVTPQQSADIANGGFIPSQPSGPVPGTYDPSIDAAKENANQGFAWTAQDYTRDWGPGGRNATAINVANQRLDQQNGYTLADLLTNQQRATQDYGTQTGYLNQDYGTQTGRLGEDYRTQSGRLKQDYTTQTGRLGEDKGIATQGLDRQYTNLGIQQAGAIRAAGAGEGGALAQAMQKRAGNQAWDQGFIDRSYNRSMQDATTGYKRGSQDLTTGYNRGTQDLTTNHDRGLAALTTAYDRGTQDYNTNVSRAGDAYNNAKYDLGTNYQYGQEDALTGYQRAGVSNTMFQNQSNALATYQAQQAGLLPDNGQKVAQSGPHAGQTYMEVVQNGTLYHRYSNGDLVPISKV